MLTFIGLGLYDEKDITVKGLEAVKSADAVFAEFYTSNLIGTSIEKIEKFYGKKLIILTREEVELEPVWLSLAEKENIVFLSGGDAMVATTHIDLRLRAKDMGIEKAIISEAPYDTIKMNKKNDLHTLVFLDIDREKGFMDIKKAASLLLEMEARRGEGVLLNSLAVGIARAGSPSPAVFSDYIEKLKDHDFGGPLHVLIIPASLHFIEAEALFKLCGAPA